MRKPRLQFHFKNHEGHVGPLAFVNPIEIMTAHTTHDVIPCLEKAQLAVDNGYYVAGYVAYEAAPAFDAAFQVHQNHDMPLVWFGIFDHVEEETLHSEQEGNYSLSNWQQTVPKAVYKEHLMKIKEYIAAGDTYQVNYTTRLKALFNGDPLQYYDDLTQNHQANYCAYIESDDFSILSTSPELFFHLHDGEVTTRPMKGTARRGKTTKEDHMWKEWLRQSEKNQAENVMIVDLLRNDLGRIAETGTVHVPELFTIEEYPTVFQMTSTVKARVDQDLVSIFKGLFPCGSITGAPKISTMNIIHELESTPRNIYCGAIGFMTPEKEAIFNVPIRTIHIQHDTGIATYGVGGGITWDSDVDEEYDEMVTKTMVLHQEKSFQLLETLGLYDGEYIAFRQHIRRLQQSAAFFAFMIDIKAVQTSLQSIKESHANGVYCVRLLVEKDGDFTTEVKVFHQPEGQNLTSVLANQPIFRDNMFLYHKTTNRDLYQMHRSQHPDVFDVLLWNEQEEVTEFTCGNIVVMLDGKLVTPPLSCGLLPGTFREQLLQEGTIAERVVKMEELANCTEIWLINSLRKWVGITMIGD